MRRRQIGPISRRRRITAMAGAVGLSAPVLLVGAPTASAAQQTIEGASFTWGLSNYIQYTGTGAPGTCHYLSAGSLDGTNSTTLQNSYRPEEGNVAIKLGDTVPTWAGKCSGFAGVTGGSTTSGPPANQRAVWSNGTGTRDSVTGATTITWEGTLSVKFSGAPFRIANPTLTVGPTGIGTMTVTIQAGAAPTATVDTPGVTIAEFVGIPAASATGFTAVPTFFGRTITVGTASQPTQLVKDSYDALGPNRWGAWPETFVNAVNTGAVNAGGRFYSSGVTSTGDGLKDPMAMTVDYGTVTTPPQSDGQAITFTVPEAPEECAGEVIWSIADDGAVSMGEASNETTHLLATGALDPITITDGRTGGSQACYPAFAVSGQVADFSNGEGQTIPGGNLGWVPNVTAAFLTAGAAVASGYGTAGPGLASSQTLATVAGGTRGTGQAGADLELKAPVDTEPGSYAATLTLTGLS